MMKFRFGRGAALGLVLLLLLSCVVAAVSAEKVDATTGAAPVFRVPAAVEIPKPAADGKKVLWDLTHGVYLDYQPSGSYSDLVTLLAANGFSSETTAAGVNNVDLSQYRVLVVYTGGSWDSAYSAAEVNAIKTFVDNGGGLLLMGENTDCPNGNIQPVADLYNTKLAVTYIDPADLTVTDLAPHPLFSGVSAFFMRAAGSIDAASPATAVAWTDKEEQVVAAVDCPLKVVITGDNNQWDNIYFSSNDNKQFAVNTFTILAATCGPSPQPEFPTVLVSLGILAGVFFVVLAARRR